MRHTPHGPPNPGPEAGTGDDHKADKDAAEKKKTTITAESFDHQVSDKMGGFFKKTFFPTMKKLVKAGLSYDEVKRLVKIPTTWGAKISGENFQRRVTAFLDEAKGGK